VAKVIESKDKLILKLNFWEQIGSLHKSISVEKSNLLEKKVVINPWSKDVLRGVRAPGTGIPFVILLGTMRFRGGKDFTAIYKRLPVEIYEFKNESFNRWIISTK
jgi:hypothetical protein